MRLDSVAIGQGVTAVVRQVPQLRVHVDEIDAGLVEGAVDAARTADVADLRGDRCAGDAEDIRPEPLPSVLPAMIVLTSDKLSPLVWRLIAPPLTAAELPVNVLLCRLSVSASSTWIAPPLALVRLPENVLFRMFTTAALLT